MTILPLIVFLHTSNPAAPSSHEVTDDYLGAGVSIEMRAGVTIDATLGGRTLGCTAVDCGRSVGAHLMVRWSPRRRR